MSLAGAQHKLLVVVERTTNKIDTRLRLYRWLVFNIVVANDDCHLKNLSFYMRPDGVALAPHYDLLSTGAYYTRAFADDNAMWDKVPMAFELPGAKYFGDVTLDSVLKAASILSVPEPVARRIVNEVVTKVSAAFRRQVDEHEARRAVLPPESAAELASEAKLLRVLEHITLSDMVPRL
jgi:serine/threonine-protein kinase HipA